jgi:tRNA(Ile)-lysidine synthase TilS/MesJ
MLRNIAHHLPPQPCVQEPVILAHLDQNKRTNAAQRTQLLRRICSSNSPYKSKRTNAAQHDRRSCPAASAASEAPYYSSSCNDSNQP